MNDARDKADLKAWFDHIWDDDTLVQDVKDEVLFYLEQLYKNQSPEFVYFKTLFLKFLRTMIKISPINKNCNTFFFLVH